MIAKFALIGSNALAAIASAAPKGSLTQRTDIGAGLYLAISNCRSVDAFATSRISIAMRSISDRAISDGYSQAEALDDSGVESSPALDGAAPPSPESTLFSAGATALSQQAPTNQEINIPNPFKPIELEDPFRPLAITDPFAKQ